MGLGYIQDDRIIYIALMLKTIAANGLRPIVRKFEYKPNLH